MNEPVLQNQMGKVVTLTLNRPKKRNALNHELIGALTNALAQLAQDDTVRVIVLTGAGKAFSAGADLAALAQLQTATLTENLADSRHLANLFEAIYFHPKPILARVNGHAIAGGCGLVAACDFSIVAERAKLGFTEVRIGFVPAIIMTFVVRKLGDRAARELLLRGHLIRAVEAKEKGLITAVTSAEELDATVYALAEELATETSGTAIAVTKRMLATLHGLPVKESLNHAIHVNAYARSTTDCKAGVRAFLHKTTPPWKAE